MLQPFGPTASMFVVLVSVSIITKDTYASLGASGTTRRISHRAAADRVSQARPPTLPVRAARHMDACAKRAARHVGRFILPAPIDERCAGMAEGQGRRT
jgi:hypothetical protein